MISLEPKTKKLLKLLGKVLLALIAVGLLAWFLLISPYLTRQEKNRFESAASELDFESNDIVSNIDLSVEKRESEKNCGRAALKSERGPLNCSVSTKVEFKVNNVLEANTYMKTTSELNTTPLREGPFAKSTAFLDNENKQTIYQDLAPLSGLRCVRGYKLSIDAGYVLEVTSSCGGPARAEHYPLED